MDREGPPCATFVGEGVREGEGEGDGEGEGEGGGREGINELYIARERGGGGRGREAPCPSLRCVWIFLVRPRRFWCPTGSRP